VEAARTGGDFSSQDVFEWLQLHWVKNPKGFGFYL
jgi:hypothetical protein